MNARSFVWVLSCMLLTGCTCGRQPAIALGAKQEEDTKAEVTQLAQDAQEEEDGVDVKTKITRWRTFDLRTLFRSEEEIERMQSGRTCSVEWGVVGSKRVEVQVGERMRLNEVVRSIYGRDYDGQIKVISRDAIVQTPIVEYDPAQQERIWVCPGDLVYVQGRD